jgi:hypothetical protein
MKERKLILLEAAAFGFGPASQATVIAHRLRELAAPESLNCVGLGASIAYDFFFSSDAFDQAIRIEGAGAARIEQLGALVGSADLILTVGDCDFAEEVYQYGRNAAVVDSLYWMWNDDPLRADRCEPYYIVNFPGVEPRLSNNYPAWRKTGNPILVNPICERLASCGRSAGLANRPRVLVNFGGMETPFGVNLAPAVLMTEAILDAARVVLGDCDITICGGGNAVQQLRHSVDDRRHSDLKVGPLSQGAFLQRLCDCDFLLTVPGISVIIESLVARKAPLFLLPLNYSQHRQQEIIRQRFTGGDYLTWDEFPGCRTLPANLPERDGVLEALEFGGVLGRKPKDLEHLRHRFMDYFCGSKGDRLFAENWSATSANATYNGAEQIAADLWQRVMYRP